MGTELCPGCQHPTKVYSDGGSRKHYDGCPFAGMCPHCGAIVGVVDSLTVYHDYPVLERQVCPGSKQNPRNAESDGRPLWNGLPNRFFGRRYARP